MAHWEWKVCIEWAPDLERNVATVYSRVRTGDQVTAWLRRAQVTRAPRSGAAHPEKEFGDILRALLP